MKCRVQAQSVRLQPAREIPTIILRAAIYIDTCIIVIDYYPAITLDHIYSIFPALLGTSPRLKKTLSGGDINEVIIIIKLRLRSFVLIVCYS